MLFGDGGEKKDVSKRRNPAGHGENRYEFSTNITAAELCRKHSVSPATFQGQKDMFLHGGKQALLNREDAAKSHAREVKNLKRIIDEITVANDILKPWRGQGNEDAGSP